MFSLRSNLPPLAALARSGLPGRCPWIPPGGLPGPGTGWAP